MAAGEHRRVPTYNELVSEFGEKGELALGFERMGDNVIVRAEKIPPEPLLDAVEYARIAKPQVPKLVKIPKTGNNGFAARISEMEGEIGELEGRIASLKSTVAELKGEMNGKKGKPAPPEMQGMGWKEKKLEIPAIPLIPSVVSHFHSLIRERQERNEKAKFREFQRKLFILAYDGPQPLAKICEFTGANPGAAAVYLSKMREQGLLSERKRRGERLFGIRR